MKYIILGDIVSKAGRKVINELVPKYIKKYQADIVIANSENLSHGKGANPKHLDEMQESGINYFTGGDHSLDTKTAEQEFENGSKRQLRCLNQKDVKGEGYFLIDDKLLILNLMGDAFMKHEVDCPMTTAENLFKKIKNEKGEEYFNKLDIIVDFHAETTSEKKAMGYFLDGIATGVVGSHTHIQTNDAQILENGTGYITDLGMNGAMESVLGVKKEIIINMMKNGEKAKFERETEGKLEFSGIFLESENGKCKKIEIIKEIITQ